ncbi:MAG: hypothetical protein MI923_16200 [Phycisphaerales bacterium]|nr:hypothetical protein [Phycisphaerales bacterium]
MRTRIIMLLCVLLVAVVPGCIDSSINKIVGQMGGAAEMAISKVADQGILDDWVVDGYGNIQDPGVEGYVTLTVAAGAKMRGINGRLEAGAGGRGTQLPKGMREAALKGISELDGRTDPEANALRERYLDLLGWNRTGAPNPPGKPSLSEVLQKLQELESRIPKTQGDAVSRNFDLGELDPTEMNDEQLAAYFKGRRAMMEDAWPEVVGKDRIGPHTPAR